MTEVVGVVACFYSEITSRWGCPFIAMGRHLAVTFFDCHLSKKI